MKTLFYILLPLAALAAALAGCNSTGCTDNQNSVPYAGFYSMATKEKVVIDSLAISGEGAPNDSLLVSPSEKVSSAYLPLRAGESATTFIIKYMQKHLAQAGVQDRVTFYYESTPYFASEECGAMYHYRITRVAHTFQILDSVGISDSLVTNVERMTIGLYFRIAEPDPDKPGPDQPSGPDEPDPDQPGPVDPGTDPDLPTDVPQEGDGNV